MSGLDGTQSLRYSNILPYTVDTLLTISPIHNIHKNHTDEFHAHTHQARDTSEMTAHPVYRTANGAFKTRRDQRIRIDAFRAVCPDSDSVATHIQQSHHSSCLELLIASHPNKRLIPASKRSLRRSNEAIVQRNRHRRRESRHVHSELLAINIRKCDDEAVGCLCARRWRVSVFSTPRPHDHSAVLAIGCKDFAVSGHVAAEVLCSFGIDGVEPDDAVRA